MCLCSHKIKMLATTLLLINVGLFVSGEDIIVTIPNGQIQGRKEVTSRGTTFYAFQQIPYAKSPIGELRFMAPQPVDNWNGVLDATRNTKVCYQVGNSYSSQSEPENEDCLFVNVYTPTYTDSSASLPVLFWIHGGAFLNGYANFYSAGPHYFLDDGVIVVTVSYRLGPFGLLSTNDAVIPGNYGLKDQNLGMQWVRDNIRYFGGDPEKVTIFGGSAGAASVAYHLQSPKSRGLYRAAIAQSGSNLVPWAYQRNHADIAFELGSKLGINAANSQALLIGLQAVSAEDLRNAADFGWSFNNQGFMQGFTFTPVLEPALDDAYLTEAMYSSIAEGKMNDVPLIIGICSEEMLAQGANANDLAWHAQKFDTNISALVLNNMHIIDEEALINTGYSIRNIYTNEEFSANPSNVVRFYSDTCFTRSIIHHAQLQSRFSDVYFYQFSYHGALGNNNIYVAGCERVQHSEDGHYLWAYGNNSQLDNNAASDVLTADRYRTMFTNFVKFLNPTAEQSELYQNIIWSKVTPDVFQYLNIDEDLTVEVNPKSETYQQWVNVYENDAIKPYDSF